MATPLPAHADEWERRLLADPDLLSDIAFAIGGPFHVMYPARVGSNIEAFRAAFAAAGVEGSIYYGKKANKAGCVVRACAEHGAGVDVASIGELTSALAQGIRGEDLMVTGPAKSDRLLWLAARHDALIAVDAPDELNRLAANGIAARVLLRVRPPNSQSRFGMTDTELDHAVTGTDLGPIRLEGFSFHLSGYEPLPRSELAAALIERCLRARDHGHRASTISLGGGFGVDYVPAEEWARFTAGTGPHWFHGGKRFDSYYPYHCATPGAAMLAAVLAHDDLAKRMRDNDIRPAIEPGRALLDRAGSTVFRVQGAKARSVQDVSYQLLTVDGTSLSLSEQWFDSEYLPDPVLWPTRPGTVTGASVGAATCLESDMLSWRRIPLPRPATAGDLLVYPNTAGYQMDSNESAFHELPLPPKVVLSDAPGGRLRWTLDAG
nr:alanine racemase [Nocardia sp. BMG111209]